MFIWRLTWISNKEEVEVANQVVIACMVAGNFFEQLVVLWEFAPIDFV
jgi:hypothetical protein